MGGSSSRFAETDWNKADGKLCSAEQTLDHAPPTDSYGIYYLTKLGVSQREYNVTDSEFNLLYKTRAVEGTLAWFDVLGAGEEDYRLRVQVDLSRRYWVVYNFGMPAFLGQMWDEAATERSPYRGGWRKPLFRRACITVTWSRYHSIVDMYEPAPPQEHNENMTDKQKTEEVACDKPSAVDEIKEESFVDSQDPEGQDGKPIGSAKQGLGWETGRNQGAANTKYTLEEVDTTDDSSTRRVIRSQCSAEDSNGDESRASYAAGSLHVASRSSSKEEAFAPPTSNEVSCSSLKQSSIGESIKWAQSMVMESVAAPYRPTNQEEGIITLDKPLLKVQEINSIVGQHQTMLIQKEEARRLKHEELLIEARLAKESRENLAIVEGKNSGDEPLNDLWYEQYEYSYHTSESEDDDTSKAEGDKKAANADTGVDESSKDNENDAAASNLLNVSSDSCLVIPSSENGTEANLSQESTSETRAEQPLVGFWTWENSIRVHRMKMDLAKGSDLALHVVLAVVTNQLRYERHATVAVAM